MLVDTAKSGKFLGFNGFIWINWQGEPIWLTPPYLWALWLIQKNIPPKNIPCWNWNLCYFKHHFLPHPPATKKKSRYARPPKNHTQYIRSSRPSLEPIHEGAFVFFPRSLGFTLTLLWSKSKVYSRSVFLEPAIHEPVEDPFLWTRRLKVEDMEVIMDFLF